MIAKSHSERGSVLMTALLTCTILTFICATSLYVATQNQTSGMQTASWQQALTGAETAIDYGVRALNAQAQGNSTAWTGWMKGNMPLPAFSPAASPQPTATGTPGSSNYFYYFPPDVTFTTTEGNTKVSSWVTVDTAGGNLVDSTSKQWYRVRATGKAEAPGLYRASGNRLDNDLRNTLFIKSNRKTNQTLASTEKPYVTRTVEAIMQPLGTSTWVRGITSVNWLSLSGAMTIDSFDSSDPSKSNTTPVVYNGVTYPSYGVYSAAKRQSNGDIAVNNSTGSDFRNTNVYGNVAESGPAIKNTLNVHGNISSPGPPVPPAVTAPNWSSIDYTVAGGGSAPPTLSGQSQGVFPAGNKNTPVYIKVNGDLTISNSGVPLWIKQHDTSPGDKVYIWVTGKLTTSGSGYIKQDPNVQVTWYVGGQITFSGDSYQNLSGLASNMIVNAYGPVGTNLTISGSSDFTGAINAPNYSTTISGGGSYIGALITNNLTMSGGSSFHYDEALNGLSASVTIGNYAFASWFEDNSDPNRKDVNQNTILY